MEKHLLSLEQTSQMIAAGRKLILAGSNKLLPQLPEGDWIAGTSPFFIDSDGGQVCLDKIFVTDVTDYQEEIRIQTYDENTLKNVYADGFDNGFTVLIIPPSSKVHYDFALNAPDYKDFAVRPLMGWISCHEETEDEKIISGKIFAGSNKSSSDVLAVAMHVKLPKEKYADLNLFHIYSQGQGDKMEFLKSGFKAKNILINGKEWNVSEYIRTKNIDPTLPIIANYNSAMINVSLAAVMPDSITMFAPVFKGVEYRLANPVDRVAALKDVNKKYASVTPFYSVICILCYLYGKLEGQKLGGIIGPVTHGEICYQLVNQTIVTLDIKDI